MERTKTSQSRGLRASPFERARLAHGSADARKIEDELRRLLALADSDHPILRQLDRTEFLTSLEPAKN